VLAALGTVRTHLAATGSREGLLSVGLGERASNRYAEKALDIIESGPRDGLAGLLGLGPGFTPSGDDFVCGALAALAVFDPCAPVDPSPIIGRFRSAGPRAADITTLGGRTLVQLACRGSFPRYLEAFVLSAFSGTPSESDIESAVDALLAHGSTSGSDTLSGFLWATERPVT
jgi:hypothetical protein